MASADALDSGLRLRSQRLRSGKSRRLPLRIATIIVALVGAASFAEVQLRAPPEPPAKPSGQSGVADAATLDQQRFVSELRPVHAEIQQSISETGLVVATFQSGSIDKGELQTRLAAVLASYRDAATQVERLQAPADMQATVQAYRNTLGTLTQSTDDLSKAYDDGDEAGVAAALAQSLQATAQWHDLADPAASSNGQRP